MLSPAKNLVGDYFPTQDVIDMIRKWVEKPCLLGDLYEGATTTQKQTRGIDH
jgi:hypothetical protein